MSKSIKDTNNLADFKRRLEQREAELTVINSVQEGLANNMEMQEIYELVGEKIRKVFDAQAITIATFDKSGDREEFQYGYEDGKRIYPDARPIDKLRIQIIEQKELILINENFPEEIEKITGYKAVAVPDTELPKSALYVPMIMETEVAGYISLQNLDREDAFSKSDVRLLSAISNSLSVALQNAELFSETEQRNAELAVINSVQEGLVAEMDMQGIYELVGERIRELFDSQVTVIATFDLENELEEFKYVFEDGSRFYPDPRKYDAVRKSLIETQELIHINEDSINAINKIGGSVKALPGTVFPKSMVYVPLVLGGNVKGYVSLQNLDREFAFSDSDVRLLNTLANSMTVALENARLFSETEQRNAELAIINSVQEGLVREMNMQGIYNLVGDRIRELFDAQVTVIRTFDFENDLEKFEYAVEKDKQFEVEPRRINWANRQVINSRGHLLITDNYLETARRYGSEGYSKGLPPKSAVFVPMMVGDEVIGSVSLQNVDREYAYNKSDVRLLTTMVNSMSVALQNARLFSETAQRNAELPVINSVQGGLVAEMDMQSIYDLVGDRIRNLFDAQVTAIVTFDLEQKIEDFKYLFEDGGRYYPNPRPYDKVREQIIETKEVLLINENAAEVFSKINDKPFRPLKGTQLAKSSLFVPMLVGKTVRGYVTLQNLDRENAFTESDVRLLTTLVNSMSVALENARLFNKTSRLLEEADQRATEMDTVNRISKALVAQLEFDALIKLVGQLMKETFKADVVYLALYDKKTNMIHFPYEYGDKNESRPFGSGFTEKIITSKEPLLINRDLDEVRDQMKAKQIGVISSSYLGVPIQIGNEAIGVISIQSTKEENRFDDNDQRLLSTIAANVGVAMENAEAYERLRNAMTELKSTQEQLVQQEKLASLGQLTAGIAHEIKNPLNFVNNFSDLSIELAEEVEELMGKVESEELRNELGMLIGDIKSNLKKIHEHGTRTDGIVKSMLLHSRGGTGRMEPTDLNAFIKEYTNLAFHGMRASKHPMNVDIKFLLDDKVGDAKLIREDFSRVLLNLINNAFDAMRTKKQNGSPDSYLPKLMIRTLRSDNQVTLEIEDNGPGIPEDISEKILQPFFTTKKGTEGTGLGLSITRDIVEAHGGTITFQSSNNGTTFSVNLMAN
ncbi:GAF domain-containing protein [Balneolaceae bacterium YR4-1]|uniref:histidine kinase n=1 Tax=Halalkalibaculum roseum TaxID=2709311 RepID=A0A6M1SL70_9BACT|nr:GAF domain-containing protein [Halalkalibaculum roseum]NGP75749.1 GAF domain-containing protein [Halalkalibaculum roseum]